MSSQSEVPAAKSALIHFGDVSAQAAWMTVDGCLELRFLISSLSFDQRRTLKHYQSANKPLPLKLPGVSPQPMVIIGFDAAEEVYYLTHEIKAK